MHRERALLRRARWAYEVGRARDKLSRTTGAQLAPLLLLLILCWPFVANC